MLNEADTGTRYFDFASYNPEDPKTCMLIFDESQQRGKGDLNHSGYLGLKKGTRAWHDVKLTLDLSILTLLIRIEDLETPHDVNFDKSRQCG